MDSRCFESAPQQELQFNTRQRSMIPSEIRRHITQAYFNLRFGNAVAAFLFPLILWFGGRFLADVPLQPSISAYYYTPMRDIFVGILFAIGSFLYLYKGFSRQENYALNCAGLLALGIAVFPETPSVEGTVA